MGFDRTDLELRVYPGFQGVPFRRTMLLVMGKTLRRVELLRLCGVLV
jgi:hypothetical protein